MKKNELRDKLDPDKLNLEKKDLIAFCYTCIDEWKTKTDSVSSNLSYLLRKKYSNQDNIQELLKIKQVNLEELGFKVGSNGKVTLDPRIKKALDDFIESRK